MPTLYLQDLLNAKQNNDIESLTESLWYCVRKGYPVQDILFYLECLSVYIEVLKMREEEVMTTFQKSCIKTKGEDENVAVGRK